MAVDGYLSGQKLHRAAHIRDAEQFDLPITRHASDVEWIQALANDKRVWVVVTIDLRLKKRPLERAAFKRAKLRGIELHSGFMTLQEHQKISVFMWRVLELSEDLVRFAPPFLIGLPPGRSSKLKLINV